MNSIVAPCFITASEMKEKESSSYTLQMKKQQLIFLKILALLVGSHACKWGFWTKHLLLSVNKCRVLQSFGLWTEALDVQNWSGWNLLTIKNIIWWPKISGVVCYAAHYKCSLFVCIIVLAVVSITKVLSWMYYYVKILLKYLMGK